ncbi:MAG TPA: NAD(P)/FAD-dependent oxidoreductase [Gemmatimonadaceae bacterium]
MSTPAIVAARGAMERAVDVVGAGPAGLAAAITLARGGRRVVIHERASDVGHRFHHDFQGLENWTTERDVLDDLASIGIQPTFAHTPFFETTLFAPDGRTHVYRSARPFYYLVRRGPGPGTLDEALKQHALAAGAELRFNDPVRHLPDGGIVADGPHGSDVIAVGYVFDTDAPNGAYAALSDRLAPQGYAYLLIADGRGTVASCMFADFHREREYLERTVRFFQERVAFAMSAPRRFGGFGNFRPAQVVQRGGMLYSGEAAGLQDALWGFGMRSAMLSGHLAAQAMLAGAAVEYPAALRTRLGGLNRAGAVNRYLYARLGEGGYRHLTPRLDAARDPRGWLRHHYHPSWVSRALYPLAARALRHPADAGACLEPGCDCTWCRCTHDEGLRCRVD